jgi:hypothetical protein
VLLVDVEVVTGRVVVLLVDVEVVIGSAVVLLVAGAADVVVAVLVLVDVLVVADVEVVDVELVKLLVVLEVVRTVLLVVDGIVPLVVDVGVAAELEVDVLLEVVVVLLDVELVDTVVVDVVVLLVVVVGGGRHAPVRTSRRHWLSVPPSASASSEMVIVQMPFGSSPTNAASASSGTSGVPAPLGDQARSVGRPEFDEYGTWPPGFALSFHSVPLKALFTPGALSLVNVTIVPAGDWSVTSRSSL